MVSDIASNEAHLVSSHFFKHGLLVHASSLIEDLDTAVKPWIESVYGEIPCRSTDSSPSK